MIQPDPKSAGVRKPSPAADISVIIPTCRPQGYLYECLESLARQTFSPERFEVLVVLNGGRDPYFREIEDSLRRLPFRSALLYAPEAGVSNARNVGLDNARGGYVCFIDDDDFVSPRYLEGLYLTAAGREGAVAASDVATFLRRGDDFGRDYIGRAFRRLSEKPSDSLFRKRKFLSSSCCKLIPAGVIAGRRFDTRLRIGEDALFMFAVSDRIRALALSPASAVYFRRLRPGSAQRGATPLRRRLADKARALAAYTRLWAGSPARYSLPLFLSRVAALFKRL